MTRVRGTHVWLPWPEGFIETPQWPGLGDPRSGAVIAVTELPHPYSLQGLTGEHLEQRRIRLLSREPLQAGAHEGILLHVEQEQHGTLFDKWLAAFGDTRGWVMVVASCRAENASSLSSLLRTLVMAARWAPDLEQPDLPPFLFDAPSGFQPAQRIGHGVLYTEDGRVPGPGSEEPSLTIAPLPLSIPSSALNPRELSEASLGRMPGVEEVELESAGPVLMRGMRGYEVVALARERNTARALIIYQLVLSSPNGFILAQGRASAAARDELLPRMQAAARSVRPTE
jgi:hypothetical protein